MSSPQLHHRHVGLILPAVLASLLSVNCSGGGTDSASPTAPANQPEIAHFAGTWTGTMTRPTGLGTIEVRWTFTNKEGKLEGPGSLTYNGVTIDAFMGAAFETFTGAPVIAAFRIERTSATALPAIVRDLSRQTRRQVTDRKPRKLH